MRTPIKLSKKHGWGKKKIWLTKRGTFVKRRKPSKRAKAKLSINRKKKKIGYKKFY